MMNAVIPILSLVIAFLALFIGPLISLRIAKRQVQASLETANKQIVAPMRQAWINSLRDIVAELTSHALHYYVAGFEDRTDEEYERLTLLEHKLQLMLNPKEEDHRRLEQTVRRMIAVIQEPVAGSEFTAVQPLVIELARQILKREWNRVKSGIEAVDA